METPFSPTPGNTPLSRVPDDYAASGTRQWFVLPEGPDAGKKLFFLDRRLGVGEGPTVLFVHGNPECSYTYRKVIAALGRRLLPAGTRIVAMDHIGFGLSDQATYEMVEMHHARNLARLVEALDLCDITLVVHDWGGPIGIGALLDSPERVANLVVLNSTVFPMPPEGPTYENFPVPLLVPWSRSPRMIPDRLWGAHAASAVMAYSVVGAPRLLARYSRLMFGHLAGRLPATERAAHAVFRDQFASAANARSSKRLVRQTPRWGHGYAYTDPVLGPQDNHAFYRDIQQRIGPLWGPSGQHIGVAGLFGSCDPLAKAAVLEQWRRALPQIEGNLHVFEGETHFIEEQRPEEIADAISRLNRRGASGTT